MALNVIMLGPPGAGKGTQATRLARGRGIPKISTGDILREAVSAGTEIGLRAKAIMARGELVGDEVIIEIVRERLQRPDALRGFVLEGFPRTVAQAAALDTIVDRRDPLIVVDIVVPDVESARRLGSRTICQDCGASAGNFVEAIGAAAEKVTPSPAAGAAAESLAAVVAPTEPLRCGVCDGRLVQRADDNNAIVRERLKVYHRQSEPLVEYYRVRPTFRSIDGAQPPDRVTADLAAAIEAVVHSPRFTTVAPKGAEG